MVNYKKLVFVILKFILLTGAVAITIANFSLRGDFTLSSTCIEEPTEKGILLATFIIALFYWAVSAVLIPITDSIKLIRFAEEKKAIRRFWIIIDYLFQFTYLIINIPLLTVEIRQYTVLDPNYCTNYDNARSMFSKQIHLAAWSLGLNVLGLLLTLYHAYPKLIEHNIIQENKNNEQSNKKKSERLGKLQQALGTEVKYDVENHPTDSNNTIIAENHHQTEANMIPGEKNRVLEAFEDLGNSIACLFRKDKKPEHEHEKVGRR